MWRLEDGTQVARMEATAVVCLAVSKDSRWIAAGTFLGELFVWDAKTHKQAFSHKEDSRDINGVDFSSDSTRLVSASINSTATVWDIAARSLALTLHHEQYWVVRAAKFSPQDNRIATATPDSIRVWDSTDGRLLVDIKVGVTPLFNTGLIWSNNHLFVVSDSHIQQIDASTGSVVSRWPLPESDYISCISLPKHGKFISYSAKRTVTFWDTSSHIQLGHIQHPQDIRSTALSPDDTLIAIAREQENIIIRGFSRIVVSVLCL